MSCDEFASVSNNGSLQKWKNGSIVKSRQISDKNDEVLLKVVNDKIVAAVGQILTYMDGETLQTLKTIVGYAGNLRLTAFDANGQYLASASLECAPDDRHVIVLDKTRGKHLFRLKHDDSVTCVAFHNDLIISSSSDKTVRIWEKTTGKLRQSLTHEDKCYNFDISPNGETLAVAHYEGLSIWSFTSNYEKLAELDLGDVRDVRFQTNEKIVAGCHDGKVFLITKDHIEK